MVSIIIINKNRIRVIRVQSVFVEDINSEDNNRFSQIINGRVEQCMQCMRWPENYK